MREKMPLQVSKLRRRKNIPQMPIRTDDANAKREDEPLLSVKPEPPQKQKETPLPTPQVAPSVKKDAHKTISSAEKKAQEKQIAFEKELEETIFAKNKKQDGTRLIVYDFDAVERLRIVGLILAEALREELYKLGGFVLVNEENMIQVMDRDSPAGDKRTRLDCPSPHKVSLNMLWFHRILRLNESFHTFLLFSPINLTTCY